MRRTALGYNLLYQKKRSPLGFTLVELLVVIAVMVVLVVMVMVFLNPFEQVKRTRDANRLTDLALIKQAIDISSEEATGSAEQILCHDTTAPCRGFSTSDSKSNNGTGWLKIDLSNNKTAALSSLPVDEINDATYHYTYCSDGKNWEINAVLESEKQAPLMGSDGGNDNAKYEIGSDLTLISSTGGVCNF
ncbi:MAG: prepilin-type N-terminal cleavage/methylation domain-containing protein [Candidatus Daviesbacteria bacterium]|nr:MAG: prepilin-type N-terminal cleavage/methylation domain-containing protein [Candidatus Daviesbacteria bacterium]